MMIRLQWPVLVFLVPFVAAIAMPLVNLWRREWCRPLTIGALIAMTASAFASYYTVLVDGAMSYPFAGWTPPIGIEWVADGLSGLLLVTVSMLGLVVSLAGGELVARDRGPRLVYFYTLFLMLMSALAGILLSGDLFNLFVFLEIASLSSYGLVGMAGGRSLIAAFRYLILGTIGASLYLLGVGYFYAITGTLNMEDLAQRLPDLFASKAMAAGLLFILIGLSIKMALIPLHGWLPDAYTQAPDSVSPLLAALVTKVSLYALVRILYWVLGSGGLLDDVPILSILGWIGAVATLAGAFIALAQRDLKLMFAYGGISHVGLMVVGVTMGNATGFAGGVFYLINDAVMQAVLFFVAGAVFHRYGTRELPDLVRLRGEMPWTIGALIVVAMSMVGIPPTGGFFGKWYIILGALEAANYVAVVAVLGATLLTLAYFVKVFTPIFWERPVEGGRPATDAPWSLRVSLGVLAGVLIALGFGSDWMVKVILESAMPGFLSV